MWRRTLTIWKGKGKCLQGVQLCVDVFFFHRLTAQTCCNVDLFFFAPLFSVSTGFQLVFNLFSTCFTFSLLALGVSYVNELNSERALRTLKLWVEHNPNFQSMEVVVDAYSDGSLMDEVMQLMISAQKAALAHGGDDSDVNIVLVRAVF